jgi:cytochrome c-type biogenesis protein CcmH/NrfG
MAVGQLARQVGQMPVALNAYSRVAALAPKTPGIRVQIARIYIEQDQQDSAMAALRSAVEAGEEKAMIGGMATQMANKIFQAYQKSDPKDPAEARKALDILAFAESNEKTPAMYFLKGAVNMTLGFTLMQEAGAEKSCDKAKAANEHLVNAQIDLPKGGSQFADNLKTMLPTLTQYADTPNQMIKAYCK